MLLYIWSIALVFILAGQFLDDGAGFLKLLLWLVGFSILIFGTIGVAFQSSNLQAKEAKETKK